MKKIMSIMLIIVLLVSVVGCATVNNYGDTSYMTENINNKNTKDYEKYVTLLAGLCMGAYLYYVFSGGSLR